MTHCPQKTASCCRKIFHYQDALSLLLNFFEQLTHFTFHVCSVHGFTSVLRAITKKQKQEPKNNYCKSLN